MTNWLNIFKHLLPRTKVYKLFLYPIKEFFEGLTSLPEDFKEHIDLIWLDLLPQETREISSWEKHFGLKPNESLTEQQRRDRLEAEWASQGGQSPGYIQDTLQANGFDVYVHEWWVEGSDPPVARNPITYIQDPPDNLLVNKLFLSRKNFTALAGEPLIQAGEPLAQAGEFNGFTLYRKEYEVRNEPDEYPFYFYIGGETFPDSANIPASRRDEFEDLILKIRPLQQRVVILADFINDVWVNNPTTGDPIIVNTPTTGDSVVVNSPI